MKIVIIGQGGHSKVIRDVMTSIEGAKVIGCLDDKFKADFYHEQIFYGPTDSAHILLDDIPEVKFIVAIGNNRVRKQVVNALGLPVETFATLIHSSAQISQSSTIGYGTVVMPCAVVNFDVEIGNHSIINSCAVIEHDSCVEDFVHISPNATLTGNVTIREGTHIGAGTTIIPGMEIGEWSVIGAGATVINNIPANSTAVGVPAIVKIKEVSGGV